MSIRFDGRVAIVTGAGGGLGRSHALELARRGAKVVVNDLGGSVDGRGGSSEAANKVVAEIKALGGDAMADGSDVRDDAAVANMVKQTIDTFGRIDIVINNAGVLRDKTFAKGELDDFKFVIDVHLMGSTKVTKACWPYLKERQYGRIVMTTSPSGIYGNFGQPSYAAAKAGILGLMQTLRIEGAKDNIRVNAIAPIAMTRMTESLFPPEMLDQFRPDFVSTGVLCLCDEEAPSGSILVAGGGYFGLVQYVQSEGVVLPQSGLDAETVRANWDKIGDLSKTLPIPDATALVGIVAQRMTRPKR